MFKDPHGCAQYSEAYEDAMDGPPDRHAAWGDPGKSSKKVCKYCGQKDLRWQQLEEGWRLCPIGTKEPHSCPEGWEAWVKRMRGA